jgi:hypothetical protein
VLLGIGLNSSPTSAPAPDPPCSRTAAAAVLKALTHTIRRQGLRSHTRKLRNSLFRMMLRSASTLHLAVDANIPVSGGTVLPGPGGQTTTVQGSQRPRSKATPERSSMRALARPWPILSSATARSTRRRQLPSTVAASTGSTPLQGRNVFDREDWAKKPRAGFEPTAFAVCSRQSNHEARDLVPNARRQASTLYSLCLTA